MKYQTRYERLLANSAEPETENGCWLWTSKLHNSNYGTLTHRVPGRSTPKRVYAHREMERVLMQNVLQLAADLAEPDPFKLGPKIELPSLDPDRETIDHLCYWRRCVNPDHWEVVSRSENTSRMRTRKK